MEHEQLYRRQDIPPALIPKLLEAPALLAPDNVIPNVTNRSDDQIWFYVCISLCAIFAGIFLLLRLYTKLRIVAKLDIADCFIILSFLLLIAEIIVGRLTIPHGAGVHQWNVQYKHLFDLLYWMNIAEILYAPNILLVKMSILVQYLKLFAPNKTVNPFVFIGAWIVIASSFIFYVVDMFFTIFACSPREKIWNKFYIGGHCPINYNAIIIATAIFNIISDIAILILPVRSVWKLRMARKKKIGITLLFATGLLACVASAMRIVYTYRIVINETKADVSFNIAWMGLWSYAEIVLGMIVACTLSLPRLVQAKGGKLSSFISSLTRPFSSLKSSILSSKGDEASGKNKYMGDSVFEARLTFDESYRMKQYPSGESGKDNWAPASAESHHDYP